MNALQVMDRYGKEVMQVSTRKHDIMGNSLMLRQYSSNEDWNIVYINTTLLVGIIKSTNRYRKKIIKKILGNKVYCNHSRKLEPMIKLRFGDFLLFRQLISTHGNVLFRQVHLNFRKNDNSKCQIQYFFTKAPKSWK